MIAPLDWGLGHITRTIPIIRELLKRGHKVITCGDHIAEEIYQKEFPNINHIIIKGYEPYYSGNNNQRIAILKQVPKFIKKIIKEKKIIESISIKEKIDIIISDNRFGIRTNRTTNIYITHQLNIMGPLLIRKLINVINRILIRKFDYTWVPDYANSELSGDLSINKLESLKIGPLSRFENYKNDDSEIRYKYLAIISGPEPHRSLIEKEIINCFIETNYKCAIIVGKTTVEKKLIENISIFPHLETKEFLKLISRSELIICRSGYSSIMDLYFLQKKVLFIPTPGQTEQEYLAKYYKEEYSISFFKQGKINLKKADFNSIQKISNAKKKLLEVAFKKANL